jgi:PPOX class probable F420-dependent enzyme
MNAKASALVDDAAVIWLTPVSAEGRPQASPVWFVVDSGEFLVFSLADTPRTTNIASNPRVSLNLDSNEGSDVVVVEGLARVVDGPSSADHSAYQAKYRDRIVGMGYTPDEFAAAYPTPIRIIPLRWRVY